MRSTTIFLIVLTIVFVSCEKDSDPPLDPVYGPVITKQFGEVTATVQELSFNSNGFKIVGDFRTPASGDTFPAIIMVHGSGNATRNGAVDFGTLIEIFIRNGYAVLSWDKPGNGESTGSFNQGYTITERAEILADAVKVLTMNNSILNSSIGLWGLSQAGWVMPMALKKTNNIAFMNVVSGGAEDGIEQMAYQVGQVVACDGGTIEQVNEVEIYWVQMCKATEYNAYKEAADILVSIPGVSEYTGLSVSEENQWNPWPNEIDAFWDPIEVIEQTTIPMLVCFGEYDKNIDPVQGAQAYETALQKAGNQNHIIVTFQGEEHILTPALTGCYNETVSSEWISEYLDTLEDWVSDQNPLK